MRSTGEAARDGRWGILAHPERDVPRLRDPGGERRPAAVTDFSRGAEQAVGTAAAWLGVLAGDGASLEVLHVAERSYRLLDPSLEAPAGPNSQLHPSADPRVDQGS